MAIGNISTASSLITAVNAHQGEILEILDAGGFSQDSPVEEYMSDNRQLAVHLHQMDIPTEGVIDNQLFLVAKIILLMARRHHQQEKTELSKRIKEAREVIDRFEQLLE